MNLWTPPKKEGDELENQTGLTKFVLKKFSSHPFKPLDEKKACHLFKAYFNNKMTVFLLLIQRRRPEPDSLTAMKAVIFFDDLYRHLLPPEYQLRYARLFQWLTLFFRRFPYVKPAQKKKAIDSLRILYRLFGLELQITI